MKSLFLLSLLLLSSCTVYNEQFEGSPEAGVGCKSLTQVNQMVDDGTLPLKKEEDKPVDLVASKKHPHLHTWIAPYTDEKGTPHKLSYHSVLLPQNLNHDEANASAMCIVKKKI